MTISSRGRYALRALIDLEINSSDNYTPLSIIAERQEISINYLEQVFSSLKKAKLVKSTRGYQGGYTLAKKASEITVGEILRILEGDLSITSWEVRDPVNLNDIEKSINKTVWHTLNENINGVVNSITLEQIVMEYRSTCNKSMIDYMI